MRGEIARVNSRKIGAKANQHHCNVQAYNYYYIALYKLILYARIAPVRTDASILGFTPSPKRVSAAWVENPVPCIGYLSRKETACSWLLQLRRLCWPLWRYSVT